MYIFDIYHQLTKRLKKEIKEPPKKEDWPVAWKTTFIKTYPRFEVFDLPKPQLIEESLAECLLSRTSHRIFSRQVTLEKLSALLYYSIGEKNKDCGDGVGRRMYPSGGARYPLEFYLIIFEKIETLETGVYHYNLTKHGLTLLSPLIFSQEDRIAISPELYTLESQFVIIGTGTLDRSADKYGEKAYRYSLVEIGTALQNLALCAEALEIGSIITGGFADDSLEVLLSIDGEQEKILQVMFFG